MVCQRSFCSTTFLLSSTFLYIYYRRSIGAVLRQLVRALQRFAFSTHSCVRFPDPLWVRILIFQHFDFPLWSGCASRQRWCGEQSSYNCTEERHNWFEDQELFLGLEGEGHVDEGFYFRVSFGPERSRYTSARTSSDFSSPDFSTGSTYGLFCRSRWIRTSSSSSSLFSVVKGVLALRRRTTRRKHPLRRTTRRSSSHPLRDSTATRSDRNVVFVSRRFPHIQHCSSESGESQTDSMLTARTSSLRGSCRTAVAIGITASSCAVFMSLASVSVQGVLQDEDFGSRPAKAGHTFEWSAGPVDTYQRTGGQRGFMQTKYKQHAEARISSSAGGMEKVIENDASVDDASVVGDPVLSASSSPGWGDNDAAGARLGEADEVSSSVLEEVGAAAVSSASSIGRNRRARGNTILLSCSGCGRVLCRTAQAGVRAIGAPALRANIGIPRGCRRQGPSMIVPRLYGVPNAARKPNMVLRSRFAFPSRRALRRRGGGGGTRFSPPSA